MDVKNRPQRKKILPLKLQDSMENITRPAKRKKMGINKPEKKKFKINDVKFGANPIATKPMPNLSKFVVQKLLK